MKIEIATVVEAGKPIDNRKLHGLSQILAQPVIEALALDLRKRARHQLIGIDRTNDVIIDAEIQRPDHHGIIVLLGDDQKRQETRSLERAQLRTKP